MELHDPIKVPCSLTEPPTIRILHPGYSNFSYNPDFDILIAFQAFDDGGVHYDTAHTACAILANNQWDGYFSHDKHGKIKVRPTDGVLRDPSFYFCLPSSSDPSTDQYPVIPRFKDWRFPHKNLPPIWMQLKEQLLAEQETKQARPGHCSLSDCADAIESAHLVPTTQSHWWRINVMKQHVRAPLFSTNDIDCPANSLPLRCDIHRMFDERHFTFVPKTVIARDQERVPSPPRDDASRHHDCDNLTSCPEPDQDRNRGSQADSPFPIRSRTENQGHGPVNVRKAQSIPYLVGHVFNSTPAGQLPRRWHNRRLNTLPSALSVECLFARFAWTIFAPSVFRYFLDAGEGRRLLVWNDATRRQEIEEADAERCRAIYTAARSRSESPSKRPRAGGNGPKDENEVYTPRPYDAASEVDSAYHDDSQPLGEDAPDNSTFDGPERGRRRKRKSEEDCESVSGIYDPYGIKRARLEPLT
ncbi:hypothetical protein EDB80DRAFT_658503 [Ilyonectria destructans]|nr:hypothetical protein EDB80DRAFT_658503 [Ilyonectria destructans]